MSNQGYRASGRHEYTYHDTGDSTLQIFSLETMSSTLYHPQEALDLLYFLQIHQSEIEEKVRRQAEEVQQPKQQKSLERRINDLFG